MIEPFANNHQSMQIGELVIENQKDKVIIYGDIDLTLDATGYQQAQQLHALTSKIIQAFDTDGTDSKDEPAVSDKHKAAAKEIENPFL